MVRINEVGWVLLLELLGEPFVGMRLERERFLDREHLEEVRDVGGGRPFANEGFSEVERGIGGNEGEKGRGWVVEEVCWAI